VVRTVFTVRRIGEEADVMKARYIKVDSCTTCAARCNASMHGVRNVYCEEHDCWNISTEDDKKGFPEWCPLPELGENK
jgi:hypothetical protein